MLGRIQSEWQGSYKRAHLLQLLHLCLQGLRLRLAVMFTLAKLVLRLEQAGFRL